MKKSILLLAFLFAGIAGFAQNADAELKTKTIQLIKLTSGAQMEVMMKPLINTVPEGKRELFKADLVESLDGLYREIADIYLDVYSEEEINKILAFYNSPTGQKMLEKTPDITERSMQLGQAWGMQLQPILAKYQE